jgi:hypothetical protein
VSVCASVVEGCGFVRARSFQLFFCRGCCAYAGVRKRKRGVRAYAGVRKRKREKCACVSVRVSVCGSVVEGCGFVRAR